MNCFKCKNKIDAKDHYGLHESCFNDWFRLNLATEFQDLDPESSTSSQSKPEIRTKQDTFFHGRYRKYSGLLGSTSYILKVQEAQFPELPIIEYICNEIAKFLHINNPPYYLINFNSQPTFVTRNFMQDYTGTLHHMYTYL